VSPEIARFASLVTWVGLSFLVHSSLLIAATLGLARLWTGEASVRSSMYQAAIAALLALPFVGLMFGASGGPLVAFALPEVSVANRDDAAGQGAWRHGTPARQEELGQARSQTWREPETRGGRTVGVAYACVPLVWFCGTAMLMAHLAWCHRAMSQLRRRATPCIEAGILSGLTSLSDSMGVPIPAVMVSDEVRGPILVGVLHPAIVLPADLGRRDLDEGLLRVLLHELAHLGRHDCLANLLGRVVCAVFSFQPLVWVLLHRMEMAADEVADDIVLSGGATGTAYARDLTDWAERYLPPRRQAVAALGVVRFRSAVGRRVQRILDAARELTTGTTLSRVVAVSALAVVLTVLSVGVIGLCPVRAMVWEPRVAEDAEGTRGPVFVAGVAPHAIAFRELDRQLIPTGVLRRFQESPPGPSYAFRVEPLGDTDGALLNYRLMDVATGRRYVLRSVPVQRSRAGGWVLTSEGRESVQRQLEAQLGTRLMPVAPQDRR